MKQIIRNEHNQTIGYILEHGNLVQAYDAHMRLIGYYNRDSNTTFKNGSFFGRGDQTMRLIGS